MMENKAKLPWDLVEEILSRVPPEPLTRFRTVSKQWNTLFDDTTFINNHKMTFRFILVTKSKFYSVSLNPEIEVRELTLDIPGLKDQIPYDLVDSCNGFFLCGMEEGAVVCNPWLGQTRYIQGGANEPSFGYLGIGYERNTTNKKIVYKTVAVGTTPVWRIHDFDTDAWKDEEAKQETTNLFYIHSSSVSLNGNLFFIAYELTHPSFFIVSYNFRREYSYYYCDLPCAEDDHSDALVLRVFKGNRFSLLKQCHVTKKIQIWVTKDKINNRSRKKVKWMSFMEVSIPNLPDLVETESYHPSYFIDDKRGTKRLVVCSCDVDGWAWIYVVGENKLISKTRLDSVVDPWPLHCTCFPSLVMVPGCQREEEKAELQVIPGCQREEEKAELQVNYSFVWFFVWLFLKLKFLFSKIKYF